MRGATTSGTRCWRRPTASADVAEVAPGKRHSIPSHDECRACHDSAGTEVLGFTALQLSDDRDPLAPHAEPLDEGMVTLRSLVTEQRLAPARPELAAAPPRVMAADARERAVLGYLSTNCGSCHNRQSTIASLGLFLKYTLERRRDVRARCAHDHRGSARALGGADGARGDLAAGASGPSGSERAVVSGQVAPAVEPDAADRHGRGRSSGRRVADRVDRGRRRRRGHPRVRPADEPLTRSP